MNALELGEDDLRVVCNALNELVNGLEPAELPAPVAVDLLAAERLLLRLGRLRLGATLDTDERAIALKAVALAAESISEPERSSRLGAEPAAIAAVQARLQGGSAEA